MVVEVKIYRETVMGLLKSYFWCGLYIQSINMWLKFFFIIHLIIKKKKKRKIWRTRRIYPLYPSENLFFKIFFHLKLSFYSAIAERMNLRKKKRWKQENALYIQKKKIMKVKECMNFFVVSCLLLLLLIFGKFHIHYFYYMFGRYSYKLEIF